MRVPRVLRRAALKKRRPRRVRVTLTAQVAGYLDGMKRARKATD